MACVTVCLCPVLLHVPCLAQIMAEFGSFFTTGMMHMGGMWIRARKKQVATWIEHVTSRSAGAHSTTELYHLIDTRNHRKLRTLFNTAVSAGGHGHSQVDKKPNAADKLCTHTSTAIRAPKFTEESKKAWKRTCDSISWRW